MQNQNPNQKSYPNQNQYPGNQSGSQSGQSSSSSSRINVPGARQALDDMKQEVASELGVNLKPGYNGDLTSRDAGSIGGGMVKRMIEQQERSMSNQQGNLPR